MCTHTHIQKSFFFPFNDCFSSFSFIQLFLHHRCIHVSWARILHLKFTYKYRHRKRDGDRETHRIFQQVKLSKTQRILFFRCRWCSRFCLLHKNTHVKNLNKKWNYKKTRLNWKKIIKKEEISARKKWKCGNVLVGAWLISESRQRKIPSSTRVLHVSVSVACCFFCSFSFHVCTFHT